MYPVSRILSRARTFHADRPAVIDGDIRLTYSQLADRVDRLASALVGLGLEPGDRIAILDWNSLRYLEAYYACAQAGLAFLPLNVRLAAPDLGYILNDSEAKALMLSAPFLGLYEEVRGNAPSLETVIALDVPDGPAGLHDYETLLAAARPRREPVPSGPDDVILIYYTSGTTGEPKGVCLTNRNMYFGGVDPLVVMNIDRNDIWLHAAPMFHLADSWAVWAMPMAGGTQIAVHFDPDRVLGLIERERVTITALPATLIAMTANHPDVGKFDITSIRQILYGGSPTPLGVLRKAAETFRPGVFLHTYGITETAGIVSCLDPSEHTLDVPPGGIHRAASAGVPAPFIDLRVVDDDGNDLRAGEIGEIALGGPKIMKEYWRKPEATRTALRDGWYRSGDMGWVDDTGAVYLVDRKKDMIITGAENVYSVEVENVLSTHPAVLEVAVIGVPHPLWGEAVKAVVVPHEGHSVSEAELIGFCRGKIAGYKIPKSIDLRDEPLPKTGPGKVAKRRLRDPYWEGHDRRI